MDKDLKDMRLGITGRRRASHMYVTCAVAVAGWPVCWSAICAEEAQGPHHAEPLSGEMGAVGGSPERSRGIGWDRVLAGLPRGWTVD